MADDMRQDWGESGATLRVVVGVIAALLLVSAMIAVVAGDQLRNPFASSGPPRPGPAAPQGTGDASPPPRPARESSAVPTGVHLTATVDERGDVAVVERLDSSWPLTRLSLSPPSPPRDGAPAPRLVGLEVTANGVVVPLPWGGAVDRDRELALPSPTTRIELSYRLRGVVSRSRSAAPGRVTVSLRPAMATELPESPAVVELAGARVHTLLCAQQPRSRQLCGIQESGGWRTLPLTGSTSLVLALIDLPGSAV